MSTPNLFKKRRAKLTGFVHPRFNKPSFKEEIMEYEDKLFFEIIDSYHVFRNNFIARNKSGDSVAYCIKCNNLVKTDEGHLPDECIVKVIERVHSS